MVSMTGRKLYKSIWSNEEVRGAYTVCLLDEKYFDILLAARWALESDQQCPTP